MSIAGKLKQIMRELKSHLPFTMLGAVTGVVLMLIGRQFLTGYEHTLFAIFHPLHVLLSAMVTAALFELHRKINNFLVILLVGVVGAIGVTTLSDSIMPYFGESILGVAIPTHAALHEHDHEAMSADAENADMHEPETAGGDTDEHEHEQEHETAAAAADGHDHAAAANEAVEHVHEQAADEEHAHEAVHPELHLGFIEEWYLVFPAAILGVVLAYFRPATKLPHAGHVLLSTWASSAHVLMNTHADITALLLVGIFIVLFLAVWLPCCVSDIIFPLLFVRSNGAHIGHSCILCGKKDNEKEGQHSH